MTDAAQTAPAQTAPAAPQAPAAAAPAPKKNVMWTVIAAGVALLGVLIVLYAWQLPPFRGAIQRTDNAYVRGQVTLHCASDPADEAEQAAACVMRQIAAGRVPVALAAVELSSAPPVALASCTRNVSAPS